MYRPMAISVGRSMNMPKSGTRPKLVMPYLSMASMKARVWGSAGVCGAWISNPMVMPYLSASSATSGTSSGPKPVARMEVAPRSRAVMMSRRMSERMSALLMV